MFDERCLTDLINQRFDDMKDQLSSLKADMLREAQQIKEKHDKHEADDQVRFGQISSDLSGFKQMKWTIMGASAAALAIFQGAIKLLEHYAK